MLGKAGRRGFTQLAGKAARKMHPLAPDIATGIAQQIQRLRILQKIDADLLKDGFGIILDDLGSLIRQDIDRRNAACDIWRCRGTTMEPPRRSNPSNRTLILSHSVFQWQFGSLTNLSNSSKVMLFFSCTMASINGKIKIKMKNKR